MRYTAILFFGAVILCWLYLAVSTKISGHMVLVVASVIHLSVIMAIYAEGRNTLRAYQDVESLMEYRLKELEKDIDEIRFKLKLDEMDPTEGCRVREETMESQGGQGPSNVKYIQLTPS